MKSNLVELPVLDSSEDEDWLVGSAAYDEERQVFERMDAVLTQSEKGGPGSGYFGHAGRPGKVGGSASTGRSMSPGITDADLEAFGGDRRLFLNAWDKLGGNRSQAGYLWKAKQLQYDQSKVDAEGRAYIDMKRIRDKKGYMGFRYEDVFITPAQHKYIADKMMAVAQERQGMIVLDLNLPDDYKGYLKEYAGLSDDDIANISSLSDERRSRMWHDANVNFMKLSQKTDLTNYMLDELEEATTRKYMAQVYEKFGEDSKDWTKEASKTWGIIQGMEGSFDSIYRFERRHKIALGEIEPGENEGEGVTDERGHRKGWVTMPDTLYHATTNALAIENDQLRSRLELNMWGGSVGLGGGDEDTISFTSDESIARNIERSFHEAYLVATGRISVERMMESAKNSGGGVGHSWEDKLAAVITENGATERPDFDILGDNVPWEIMEARRIDNIADEKKRIERTWGFYNYKFLKARNWAGGFQDPVFWGTSWEKLAKLDPKQFKILVFHPKPKSRGYQMSGLAEWRTVGGDTVERDYTEDYYLSPDDVFAILGD